ncbi:putative multidrug resistance ABC transporter ATP-binding/permease protein YheI [Rubripirellula lacrimiformis]|uniref:Putative multidrug resistance ABC transporter ATP-binding/permease protein YheI n=1 Tax=Rubripirellula lacrimiformis TaxID=1930273 RepID=A0A517NJR8_9BACT|nr:ABC transporter ATP-binding protein [Rubripirellula lacrimiformis]QDT07378.1 putative multidrug resistance ABC transporter ATP-binding/permease protein YheI [Rubripirellula lacrimiformis]
MDPTHHTDSVAPDDQSVLRALTRVGQSLNVPIDLADVLSNDSMPTGEDSLWVLQTSATQAGIVLDETHLESGKEAFGFLSEGHPVVLAYDDGTLRVLEKANWRSVEMFTTSEQVNSKVISRRQLTKLFSSSDQPRMLIARKQFECESISASSPGHSGDHAHPTPLRRFIGLLSLDRGDVGMVVLFALVAGVLTLATPLAVESLVNVVSWGTQFQPLIILGLMLLTCLSIAGVLRVLQTVVVEIIQRRQFVRIASDLAHRFPRANQAHLESEYPRELANRFFDIMTIQKATAVLLLDGVSIVLTTVLGMIVLAFYHPFLLGFDVVLVISMVSIIWVLGRGGIRTSIEESVAKYRVAHWLQDVIAQPSIFKTSGGEVLAIQRTDRLTADYIAARQRQFRVVIRQVGFAMVVQVVASTALLALGGWLVIGGALTLGQLVASELIVTVVVGAFAKAGKSLEKFYDLMAGIDKVGHLIDIPADQKIEIGAVDEGPAAVSWSNLSFRGTGWSSKIPSATIRPGDRVAITGDDVSGRSYLARAVAGLTDPREGLIQICGIEAAQAATSGMGKLVAYAGMRDIFHGTVRENIDLGRRGIGQHRVRQVVAQVGLTATIEQLENGLQTTLQTGGHPLCDEQIVRLLVARALAVRPKLLVIDGLLDDLDPSTRDSLWQHIAAVPDEWTLLVFTNRSDVADLCDQTLFLRQQSSADTNSSDNPTSDPKANS